MTIDLASAQTVVCAHLIAQIMDLPRDDFGDEYRLAVAAAYQRVETIITDEMIRCAGGHIRGGQQ